MENKTNILLGPFINKVAKLKWYIIQLNLTNIRWKIRRYNFRCVWRVEKTIISF